MPDQEGSFSLWSPVIDDDRKGCRFDARPYDFVQLSEGSSPLIRQFATCLGICEEIQEWRISRFCSSYFADTLGADTIEDRYPLAWRVEVRFQTQVPQAIRLNRPILSPRTCGDFDPTWLEAANSWSWSQCDCHVIANFLATEPQDLRSRLADSRALRMQNNCEFLCIADSVVQLRLQLGVLDLLKSDETVNQIVQEFRTLGAAVDWETSARMEAELQRYR